MKGLPAALLVVLATTQGALSYEMPIPKVDFDEVCRGVAQNSGRGAATDIYNQCFDRAQAGYDEVKKGWPELTNQDRLACAAMLIDRKLLDYYLMMAKCVTNTAVQRIRERADSKALDGMPKRQLRE